KLWVPDHLIQNHRSALDQLWHRFGGRDSHPFTRTGYEELGFDDDAMLIDQALYGPVPEGARQPRLRRSSRIRRSRRRTGGRTLHGLQMAAGRRLSQLTHKRNQAMHSLANINPLCAARLNRRPVTPRLQLSRQTQYARLPAAPLNASPVPPLTSLYHF